MTIPSSPAVARPGLFEAARATGAAPAQAPAQAPAPVVDAVAPARASAAPDRAERISHFLKGAGASSLQHLRFLSSVIGGELVGMAVGAAVFTPLALSTGNLYVMTGGAALTGAAGSLVGYWLENRRKGVEVESAAQYAGGAEAKATPKFSGTDAALAAGTALSAMPRVLYPTISGATAAEKQMIQEALDALPLKDATSVATIDVVNGLQDQGVAGVAHSVFTHSRILLDRAEMAIGGWNKEVVTHEVGHTVDMREGLGPIMSASSRGGFGKPPFVSDYATTNRMEDFAESYVRYRNDPEALRRFADSKHEVIDRITQPSLGERLVDRPEVREASKNVSDAIGKVPHLRTALELAVGLLGPVQVHRGAEQLEKGFAEGDDNKKFQGKLTLAQGALLMIPGAAPMALGAAAAHLLLSGQVQHGMDPARANDLASKVLAVSLGPVGMIGSAVAGELERAGVDLDKASFQPGEFQAKKTGDSFLKGLLWTVGGMGAGSVIGAAVGTAFAGLPGALIGSQWGHIGGAALGLSGYGVARALQSRKEGGTHEAMDLTRGDIGFLAKIGGGAVVGGAAGAVAGSLAGQFAGAAVGAAIAGPTGAAVGATVGRYAGMLGGSYALGKGGAALGRKLDSGDGK